MSAALNPELIPSILSRNRHEIGVHGWIHEHLGVLNNEVEEPDLLNQSIAALTKAIGKRPVSYRAPSWAMSRFTMTQVREAGFLYDSSLMASDDAYEVTIDGQPSGVIELPIERILDDAPFSDHLRTPRQTICRDRIGHNKPQFRVVRPGQGRAASEGS